VAPDNRRILVAAAISFAILLAWQWLFPPPRKSAPPPVAPDAGAAAATAAPSAPASAGPRTPFPSDPNSSGSFRTAAAPMIGVASRNP
jgi:YidC/Oxa1 family membrane protein insertase